MPESSSTYVGNHQTDWWIIAFSTFVLVLFVIRRLTISSSHAGAIILRVAYGYQVKDHGDEFVKAGNDAMDSFNKGCSPGAFMVNQMPIREFKVPFKAPQRLTQ